MPKQRLRRCHRRSRRLHTSTMNRTWVSASLQSLGDQPAAELLGLIEALRVGLQVKRDHDPDLWFCVEIRTNPKSVIGWLDKWKERGWSIVLGNQSQVNLLRLQPCFEMIWRMKVARAFRYIPREDYRSDVMTRRMDLAEISIC